MFKFFHYSVITKYVSIHVFLHEMNYNMQPIILSTKDNTIVTTHKLSMFYVKLL